MGISKLRLVYHRYPKMGSGISGGVSGGKSPDKQELKAIVSLLEALDTSQLESAGAGTVADQPQLDGECTMVRGEASTLKS